jgi:hypothetical protein
MLTLTINNFFLLAPVIYTSLRKEVTIYTKAFNYRI